MATSDVHGARRRNLAQAASMADQMSGLAEELERPRFERGDRSATPPPRRRPEGNGVLDRAREEDCHRRLHDVLGW